MRVGITLLTNDGHNVWNNGIGQNVYHLACLLEQISFVETVALLDCGDQGVPPNNSGAIGERFPLIPIRDASDAIDVVIELSGGLDGEWAQRFRFRGGKVVSYLCGQPYAAFVEPTIFGRPAFFSLAQRCDEVWLLPKDRQFQAMLRGIHRCPVGEVPYLWAPTFLDDTAQMIEQDGLSFGYREGSLTQSPAIAAIFEPNISTIKMGIVPFLVCEEVHHRSPARIERLHFMNTLQLAEHPTFVALVGGAELYKAGKVSLEARDYFARVMGRGANVVISHQIDCSQNYLYLDVLHGNYPLIHNSPLFVDVGYYYPESDIAAGCEQFERACREHDRNLAEYRQRATRAIRALSPANRANQDVYARRLLALGGSALSRRAA